MNKVDKRDIDIIGIGFVIFMALWFLVVVAIQI